MVAKCTRASALVFMGLTCGLASCRSDSPPPVVTSFCGQLPSGEQAAVVDVVVQLDDAYPDPGRLLVRVDSIDDPVGFQLLNAGPSSVAASLRVEVNGPGTGCATTVADTVYLDVRTAPLTKGWLRAKTTRPVRVHVRRDSKDQAVGPVLTVGSSVELEWSVSQPSS